jgi:hypothetical protein
MTMPETSMHEYRLSSSWKYQVRRSRQIATMQAKAISEGVCYSADDYLWIGIPSPYSAHKGGPRWVDCLVAVLPFNCYSRQGIPFLVHVCGAPNLKYLSGILG